MTPPLTLETRLWMTEKGFRFLFVLLTLMTWGEALNAQSRSPLSLHLDVMRFHGQATPYVELHVFVSGKGLVQLPTPDGMWRAALNLMFYFEKDGVIAQFDQVTLHSPLADVEHNDFMHILRYGLDTGRYELYLEAWDPAAPTDTVKVRQEVLVQGRDSLITLSDLLLLRDVQSSREEGNFVRNGYYMEPLPHRFYSRAAHMLYFYQEVYPDDTWSENDAYFFVYYLEEINNRGGRRVDKAISRKRKVRKLDPILNQMDISRLPSGNYALVTEVRDQEQQLLATSRAFFQRSNPGVTDGTYPQDGEDITARHLFFDSLSLQELNYALRAITARVLESETDLLNAIIRNPNPEGKRNFLLNFYTRSHPADPGRGYNEYMEIAREVDRLYKSGFGYGFETDRGYILLKYGKPNELIDIEDEPHAPPYQIWVYDEFPFTGQRGVKFLFYNPNLAPGDYQLLHSTARNERQNPRWEIDLYSRLGAGEIRGSNIQDATGVQDNNFRMARRYFEDN
jgi:GWxTD domain-containing protein